MQLISKSTDVAVMSNGSVQVGVGLPPVPQKLVTRIQAGEFVDMAFSKITMVVLNRQSSSMKISSSRTL